MINSLWMKSSELQKFSRLLENINTDVCVIGGGIAGLTTAYLLSKEGKKVCVLEDFELGHGQTGKTSAHFSYVLGTRYYELKEIHGFDKARLAAHAHLNALEKIESIVTEERASCDFKRVNGYLYLGKNDKKETLMKELEVLHSFGLREVHSLPKLPIGSFNSGPCLCFPKQIQMHPLKYIKHLIEKIKKNGGQIFTHTHVADIESGKPITVKTKDNFTVHADKVVVATNSPINNIFTIHTKQAPYRTYVIGFKVPKKSIANALYWDTEDPYHYVRLHEEADFDILIVGGEDHKTGQKEHPEICFSNLEGWVKEKFPMIQGALYKWSGQVMETVDGLAYLGKNPHDENIYIITGDCGNGLTHGTIGATLITDQICNRENEFEEVFSPSRKSFRSLSLKEYLRENANVALQYAEWLTAESYANVDRLEIGEGTVINQGLKKIAVYKNSKGELELKSATCTHLGCVVTWNTVEKTWDCPCHGSRYECDGKVIEGPATRDLKEESA